MKLRFRPVNTPVAVSLIAAGSLVVLGGALIATQAYFASGIVERGDGRNLGALIFCIVPPFGFWMIITGLLGSPRPTA